MADTVEKLRAGDRQEQQEAAIDIATTNLDRTISKGLAEKAAPLLKQLLRSDAGEKRGTAACALARIARDYPGPVRGISEDLVELLDDDTEYQDHQYNATSAILALAALEAKSCTDAIDRSLDRYQKSNAQRAWAAGTLTLHYLSSDNSDAVDYKDINFVCAEGVTLFAQQRLDGSADDYTVAAMLLDDLLTQKEQWTLKDILLTGANQHPDKLGDALPKLEDKIRNHQHRSAEYALWVLRNYVEEYPRDLVHLADDVAAYLSPSQGYEDPGSATGFLAEVAPVAPAKVAAHRERIEELQDYQEEYVQSHCRTILEHIEDVEPEGSSDLDEVDSGMSEEYGGKAPEGGSSEEVETGSDQSLAELRENAEEDAVESIPESASTTTQVTLEYSRSDKVKKYVKARADGYCEGCGEPAPFTSATGEQYLHAHHVHELSKGGSDTPETVIALCPNCHYRVHHGEDGEEYNEELKRKLAEIEDLEAELS